MYVWMSVYGQMDGWMDGMYVQGWIDGQMDGYVGMDGWMFMDVY